MAKKTTASDWDKALSSWTKKPAVTSTKQPTKKKNTSTSDRLRDNDLGKTQTVQQRPVSTSDRLRPVNTTQGPATREEAKRKKKKSTPAADPFAAALDTWRSKVVEPQQQQKRVQYEVPERKFDYGIDRVDTRPGQFTVQQQQSPTRTTTVQPYDPNTAQGPQERPTGIAAWLPKNFAFARPVAATMAAEAIRQPELRDSVGALVKDGWNGYVGQQTEQALDPARRVAEGWGNVGEQLVDQAGNLANQMMAPVQMAIDGWTGLGRSVADDFTNSAAYEQRNFDIENRNAAYDAKYGEGGPGFTPRTVDDYWAALDDQRMAVAQNIAAFAGSAIGWGTGKFDLPGAAQYMYENSSLSPLIAPYSAAAKYGPWTPAIAPYTEGLGNKAMNTLDTVSAPSNYLYNNVDLPTDKIPFSQPTPLNNQPISAAIASFADVVGRNLKELYNAPISSLTGTNPNFDWTTEQLVEAWRESAQKYADATTPTPEQKANNTPEELRMMRQRSQLMTLGGLDPVQESFDYAANRDERINELNGMAAQELQLGAQSVSEQERQEHWTKSAEYGYEAERMRTEHPIEAARRFTNVPRQLFFELILPDATDLVGAGWQYLELTPKLRRATAALRGATTPTEKVAAELAKMTLTAENAAKIAGEVSDYNPWALWRPDSWWTVGTSRATKATERMRRYLVPLLSEAQTTADAKTLLYTLATDPAKLVTGMDGRLFQSTNILARMDDDGLVRFGLGGLEKDTEALRIFQQASPAILESPTLEGMTYHGPDFFADYTEVMNSQGYRYYNVAADADIPTGATSGRIRTQSGGQAVVEFIGPDKKVISTSPAMKLEEARKVKQSITRGGARKSVLGEAGRIQRSVVSLPYIVLNPGTYVTNTLGGIATAMGDGDFAVLSKKYIQERVAKLYGGVNPTERGSSIAGGAASSASQYNSTIPGLKQLRNIYSGIDETIGSWITTKSGDEFLSTKGRKALAQELTPILQSIGITDAKEIRRINNHIFEVGYQGGDIVSEFNKVINGQTRIFSLSDANETWLHALPYEAQEKLYNLVRTAPNTEELYKGLDLWADEATRYWDELIAASPTTPQRYAWQKLEAAQDVNDLARDGKKVAKYGDIPKEQVAETVRRVSTETQAVQQKLEGLIDVITGTADPKNRYAIYGVWAQIYDLKTNVRVQLAHLAEEAYDFAAGSAEAKQAWQRYWQQADEMWTGANSRINKLLDDTNAAIARGDDLSMSTNAIDTLERTAKFKEESLWRTMGLNPRSGRYDARLNATIEAGRLIADKAAARALSAARRFLSVDAMDHIISAEHAVQIAGGQVRDFLDKSLEKAIKKNITWDEYFTTRNEAWRQLRQYERDMWGIAERNIVADGLQKEGTSITEVVRTGEVPAPAAADDLSGYYSAPKPITSTPEVPTMDKATAAKADDYLAQNAAANPMPAEAEKVLASPTPSRDVETLLQKGEAVKAMPAEAKRAPLQPANDLNALRKAAKDAGIPTLTDAGRPMDKRLVNTINKDLGIKLRGLRDLTPEQYQQALEALAKRATPVAAAAPAPKERAELISTINRKKNNAYNNDVMMSGEGLVWFERQNPTPKWVAEQFDAHGAAGSSAFDLLDSGIDPNRTFYSSPWSAAVDPDSRFGLTVRASSNFIVLGAPGKPLIESGIKYVLADGHYSAALPELQRLYPNVEFIAADNVAQRLTEIVNGKNYGRVADRYSDIKFLESGGQEAAAAAPIVEQAAQVVDDAITPAQMAEYKALPRATVKGMFESDLRDLGYSDEAIARMSVGEMVDNALGNVAPVAEVVQETVQPSARAVKAAERSTPETIAIVADELQRLAPASSGESISLYDVQQALQARGLEWDEASLALRDMQLDGGVALMRQDDPQLITSLQRQGRYAEIVVGDDARQVVYPNPALAEYIEPEMRTYDFTVEAIDYDAVMKRVKKALRLGGDAGDNLQAATKRLNEATGALGGAIEGDLAQGAQYAKLQIQNMVDYIKANGEEILRPTNRVANEALPQEGFFRRAAPQATAIGERSSLDAVNEFRKRVSPLWDNVRRGAAEYGDKMRSFSMVDFANTTRLDEVMGLGIPYGFWMTRSSKNALERALFEPQIWRRVMQADKRIREVQERQDAPERYEGSVPLPWLIGGEEKWIRALPSKYWPTFGLFTMNDYADPESANSAMGYADESLRAANLSTYPWYGAIAKVVEGKGDEIYPMNSTPLTRMLADWMAIQFGPDVPRLLFPGYLENTISRALTNMVYKGDITKDEALIADQFVRQKRTGEANAPEQAYIDPARMEKILRDAYAVAGWDDFDSSFSSWLTGANVKGFDPTERKWLDEQGKYYNNQYGPDNQYGSYAARQNYRDAGMLTQAKAAVTNPEKRSPVEIYATEKKREERDAITQEMMDATDKFIQGFDGTPENYQINDFKNQWMRQNYPGDPPEDPTNDYFGNTLTSYLKKKYPSAGEFDSEGGFNYQGYAPEEVRIKARTAAYYKAKEEIETPKPPVYPGDKATKAQYNTYFTAKDKYDADKVAYDKAIVDRVAELINDPVALQELIGRAPQPGPQTYMDYVMGQFRPLSMDNVFGYPVRPTGEGTYNYGLTDLAGDPETAQAIVEAEKTKYMSALEKQVRAANDAKGGSSGGGGRRSYNRRTYSNRRSSGRRGYSRRRSYGGGGGGGGGNYYVPNVEGRGLSEWLNVDPERIGYRAPNQVRVNPPDIGPDAIKAWKKLSW